MTYLHVDIIWALWNNGPVIFPSGFPASPLNGSEQDGRVKRQGLTGCLHGLKTQLPSSLMSVEHMAVTKLPQRNVGGGWTLFSNLKFNVLSLALRGRNVISCVCWHTLISVNDSWISMVKRRREVSLAPGTGGRGKSAGCLVVGIVLMVLAQAGHCFLRGGKVFSSSRLRYHNTKK